MHTTQCDGYNMTLALAKGKTENRCALSNFIIKLLAAVEVIIKSLYFHANPYDIGSLFLHSIK